MATTEEKPELFANWTTPVAIPLGEPDIQRDDQTPSILDQAKANGWNAAYYHFGLAEGDGSDMFNPALIQREDGYWLLVRRSEPHPQGFTFGQNQIWAFKLDETGKVPKMGIRLKWPVNEPEQHFEDPRGFYHPRLNQTLVGACTFLWHPDRTWTGAHQAFGAFDENWECKKMDYPRIGGNPGQMMKIADPKNYEKNWIWFMVDERLHLLYKANPWTVYRFGNRWTEIEQFKLDGVSWPFGEIRGGTTPVLIGDLYFTFHHSSLPWKGRYRRYYAGAIGFEPFPPYKPKLITKEPLLFGSQRDPWQQRKPLVVFPCGALFINGKWLLSLGINDIKSAYVELSHESLLSRMVPIDETGAEIFQKDGSKGILSGGVESNVNLRTGESTTESDVQRRHAVDVSQVSTHSGSSVPPAQTNLEAGGSRHTDDPGASAVSDLSFAERWPHVNEISEKQRRAEIAKQNRQAGAARARAARMAKRNGGDVDATGVQNSTSINPSPRSTRKRRRRKLRKRPSAHARAIALQEFEAKKSVATTETVP